MKKSSGNQLTAKLKQAFLQPLPGEKAHLEMVPVTRQSEAQQAPKGGGHRLSAVMVLFYLKNDKSFFVLVKRSVYDGVHSGQISLPGGQVEKSDTDYAATALRETHEEIGIDPEKVQILGRLSAMYIPPSNFDVYPFVGFYPGVPHFKIDPVEINQLMEIDLETFLNPECKTEKYILHRSGVRVKVPCFYLNEEVVWGATAMILNELRILLSTL